MKLTFYFADIFKNLRDVLQTKTKTAVRYAAMIDRRSDSSVLVEENSLENGFPFGDVSTLSFEKIETSF